MSLDLSPLRPWERAATDAYEWTEMVQIANAYHEAVHEVDAEAAAIKGTPAGRSEQ